LKELPIRKDLIQHHVELPHVILPKPILVPARGFKQEAMHARDGEVEGLVPFWIQRLADYGGRFLGFAQGDDKILTLTRVLA
jgi:hypothetical protein